jgi:predicted ArsR family transcriptional regulator
MTKGEPQKQRGERHRARMLELMEAEAQSVLELAQALRITPKAIYDHLNRLMASPRRVYVAGHRKGERGRPQPLYKAGDLPDAEYVTCRKPKLPEPIVITQTARIVALLAEEPRTSAQISEAISRSTSRVNKYLSELRAEGRKQVYIAGWQHPGKRGDLAPIYALGDLQDAPKPHESRADRYRKEVATHELRSRKNAKRRATEMAKRTRIDPQNPFSALFTRS